MFVINSFRGKYSAFSNFSPASVVYKGVQYPTVENAFQAAKSLDPNERLQFRDIDPKQAKRLGRRVQLRPDWESVKDLVMYELLLQKFAKGTPEHELLMSTGNTVLIEGNYWHDNYWGACDCPSCTNKYKHNLLGKTLMMIREGKSDKASIINGDVTTLTSGTLVHQVNCRGAIGAGVSGAIIVKWPEVKEQYDILCHNTPTDRLLGVFLPVQVGNVTIISLFAQRNYGNGPKEGICYTDIPALVSGLTQICREYTNVYAPYGIGCGLAGADWGTVFERVMHLPITFVRKG